MNFGYVSAYSPMRDVVGAANVLGALGKPDTLDGVDLFVLFGGADISPWFYGEKPNGAQAMSIPSRRDQEEAIFFREAIERGIPVLGICRGAQLACCLLGGKLYQHVDNHEGFDHDVIVDGKTYKTNSYHHQMMIPTEDMEIIGYTPCLSPYKVTGKGPIQDFGDEAEIVLHRKKKVLMVQGHPEWCPEEHDLFKLTGELVRKHLWNS